MMSGRPKSSFQENWRSGSAGAVGFDAAAQAMSSERSACVAPREGFAGASHGVLSAPISLFRASRDAPPAPLSPFALSFTPLCALSPSPANACSAAISSAW